MEAKDFQALVEQLGELTAGQRDALVEAIKRKSSVKDAVALIETRFAAAPRCGHCRSEKVATWAKPNPLTRYKCSACGKTFNALTGTPLARLQRRDAWLKYAMARAQLCFLSRDACSCTTAWVMTGMGTPMRSVFDEPVHLPGILHVVRDRAKSALLAVHPLHQLDQPGADH